MTPGNAAILDYLVQTRSVSALILFDRHMGQMFTFSYDDTRQITKTGVRAPGEHGAGFGQRQRDLGTGTAERLPDPDVFLKQSH